MQRPYYLGQIEATYKIHSVCALLGPRQVGKTTLARDYAAIHYGNGTDNVYFFDLENPNDLARLESPMLTLSGISQKLIVIDEIQRRPDLFPILRVLVDRPDNQQRFLILGSASRDLIRQSSETLAGRIGHLELPPFTLTEVHNHDQLWLRGGFPRSYLALDNTNSFAWREDYITTFLERDVPALGFNIPPQQLRRFWLMLVHYHGQIFNASELGRSLTLSDNTIRRYLDILTGTFMIRTLQPWFANISKRQVKSPKIYFKDSGILHALLNIFTHDQLQNHRSLGALWEGFALEEIIRNCQAKQEEAYFWATQADAELDLLIIKRGKKIGFEFKYTDYPKLTKSMHIACNDLELDHLAVIFPGKGSFPLTDRIVAYGLEEIDPIHFF